MNKPAVESRNTSVDKAKLSKRKIFFVSEFEAPSALRMPISLFLNFIPILMSEEVSPMDNQDSMAPIPEIIMLIS